MKTPETPLPARRSSGSPSVRGARRVRKRPIGLESLETRVVCSGLATSPGVGTHPHIQGHSGVHFERTRATNLGFSRVANVSYMEAAPGTSSQLLDVYRPAGTPPPGGWPVVLAIHGGGWRRFSKDEYAAKVAPTLLARGYAVVAPNYTLSYPGAPSWPAPLDELRQAVRWVRANASSLALDPARIAAMGESAGGHLALMLGTDPAGSDTHVEAVIDFFGPADLASLRVESPGARVAINQFLGPGATDPFTLADASPIDHVAPGDPPVLIVQGTADTLVPFQQSREMATALTAAHVPNELILVPGAGHGFGFNPNGKSVLPAVLGFLDRALAKG